MANRRSLRNSLEIERGLKLRLAARVMAFAAVYVCLSTFLLAMFYVRFLHPELAGDGVGPVGLGVLADLWREVPELRRPLLVWATGLVGMSAVFATSLGLHFGHLVAGPVHRLKVELGRIEAGGEVRPIALRDGDALQHLAHALNRALSSIDKGQGAPAEEPDAPDRGAG